VSSSASNPRASVAGPALRAARARTSVRVAELDAHQEAVQFAIRAAGRFRSDPAGSGSRSRRTGRAAVAPCRPPIPAAPPSIRAAPLWVFGDARLISSASSTCENTGPGWNWNCAPVAIEHGHADDVRRQQVVGELHPLELQAQRDRQRVSERGLADAGQVLDQEVPACEQAGQRQADLRLLAHHDLADLGGKPIGSSRAFRLGMRASAVGLEPDRVYWSTAAGRSISARRADARHAGCGELAPPGPPADAPGRGRYRRGGSRCRGRLGCSRRTEALGSVRRQPPKTGDHAMSAVPQPRPPMHRWSTSAPPRASSRSR